MEKHSTITTLTTRRPKWKYAQPPPTPRILHLPRRPLRRKIAPPAPVQTKPKVDRRGKLESLFDQDREFARGALPILMVRDEGGGEVVGVEKRRERVEERESSVAAAVVEEEKWRVQAEMLRSECSVLRMEKEIALKKVERRKVRMQRTLQSAVQTLLSGRERISNGENGTIELEEEIVQLAEKLEKLQRRSSTRSKASNSNGTIKSSNFDKRIGQIQEMAEASLSIRSTTTTTTTATSSAANGNFVSEANCNVVQIEILRRKMEGLSRGTLLERMEDEYGSMLSTASTSAASSASNSRRIELPEMAMASFRHPYKERKSREEQQQQQQQQACTGSCKAIVRRVMEQVRAETEQWSQMQAMLGQVRDEMEGLQVSKQFWEDRALEADSNLQHLHSSEQEWRQKACSFEDRSKELEEQVSELQKEIERLKKEAARDNRATGRRNLPVGTPNEMEKRVLACRMKENRQDEQQQFRLKDALREERRKSISAGISGRLKRSPFRDVGNSLPLPLPKQPLWV
ncbi:unnamed protein product [Linum tenue]|uniref:Uncharacterized protein n=1 Tax=Linum tenue TaxID=586396 RepID=A0AAV0JT69_9ROSI|nr:unnamed protein product [Linum tenue]